MKLIRTSTLIVAMSAMLAGPVLAQGTSSGGVVQGRSQMQGGASGSGDEDFNSPGAAGVKSGAKAGTKGTVGSSRATPSGAAGTADDSVPAGKRH